MKKYEYKILYVEDEDKIRDAMLKIFLMFFEEVYVASNGKEAIELFEKHDDISMVITDIEMPILSGIDFMTRVREINKTLPIFVTSAYPQIRYEDKIKNLAINKYFVKPTRFNVIIEEVKAELGIN